MKYFYDTEFIEGPQDVCQWGMKTDIWLRIGAIGFVLLGMFIAYHGTFLLAFYFLFPALILLGISFPSTPPTIDLISIAMVDENDKELYLISNEFALGEAWERYQLKKVYGDARNRYPNGIKEYWIRENVLRPLFNHLVKIDRKGNKQVTATWSTSDDNFTRKNLRRLLKVYGSSREDIKQRILAFTEPNPHFKLIAKEGEEGEEVGDVMNYIFETNDVIEWKKDHPGYTEIAPSPVQLWADYCAYDHVVFAWIFGRMMDLPSYMPMYTNDLQQLSDSVYDKMKAKHTQLKVQGADVGSFIPNINHHPGFPKNNNKHDALADAKWVKSLYHFLKTVTW